MNEGLCKASGNIMLNEGRSGREEKEKKTKWERQKKSGGDGGGARDRYGYSAGPVIVQTLSTSYSIHSHTLYCSLSTLSVSILYSTLPLHTLSLSLLSIVYSANRSKIMIGPVRAISVAQSALASGAGLEHFKTYC